MSSPSCACRASCGDVAEVDDHAHAVCKGLGPKASCSECGRDLHGYKGPRCRYCDGTAE